MIKLKIIQTIYDRDLSQALLANSTDLVKGNYITNKTNNFALMLTEKGGLSLFNVLTGEEIWFAEKDGKRVKDANQAYMQPDGNFVLYKEPVEIGERGSKDNAVWESNTFNHDARNPNQLSITGGGELKISAGSLIIIKDLATPHGIDSSGFFETLIQNNKDLRQVGNETAIKGNHFELKLTEEGGLSLFNIPTGEEIWFAEKDGKRVKRADQAYMQLDGNFVLYKEPVEIGELGSAENSVWDSKTSINDPDVGNNYSLALTREGQLIILNNESLEIVKAISKPSKAIINSSDFTYLQSGNALNQDSSNSLKVSKSNNSDPLISLNGNLEEADLTSLGNNGKFESALVVSGDKEDSSKQGAEIIRKYAQSDPSDFNFVNPLEETNKFNAKTIFTVFPKSSSNVNTIKLRNLNQRDDIDDSSYTYKDVNTAFMLARGQDRVPRLLKANVTDNIFNDFKQLNDETTDGYAEFLYSRVPSIKGQYKDQSELQKDLSNKYSHIGLSSKSQIRNGNPQPYIELHQDRIYNHFVEDEISSKEILTQPKDQKKLSVEVSAGIDAYLSADARLLFKSINLADLRIPIWQMNPEYIATGIVFAGETRLKKNSVTLKHYNSNNELVAISDTVRLNKQVFAVEKNNIVSDPHLKWLISSPNTFDTSTMSDAGIHYSTIFISKIANVLTPKTSLLTIPLEETDVINSLRDRFELIKRTLPINLSSSLKLTLEKQARLVDGVETQNSLTSQQKNYLIDNYVLNSLIKVVDYLSDAETGPGRKQTFKQSQNVYRLLNGYLNQLDSEGQRGDFSSYSFYLELIDYIQAENGELYSPASSTLASNLLASQELIRQKINSHDGSYSSLINLVSPLKKFAFDPDQLLNTESTQTYQLLTAPDFPGQKQSKLTPAINTQQDNSSYRVAVDYANNSTSNGIHKPVNILSDKLIYGQSNDFYIEGFPSRPPASIYLESNRSRSHISIQRGIGLDEDAKGTVMVQIFDRFKQARNPKYSNNVINLYWNGREFKSLEDKGWSSAADLLNQSGVKYQKQDQNLMVRSKARAAFKKPMASFAFKPGADSPTSIKTLAMDDLKEQLSSSSHYLLLEDDHFYVRSKRPSSEANADPFVEREMAYEFNSSTKELNTYLRPISTPEERVPTGEQIHLTTSEPIYFKRIPEQFSMLDPTIGSVSYKKSAAMVKGEFNDSVSSLDSITFRVKPSADELQIDLNSLDDYSYVDIKLQSVNPENITLVFINQNQHNLDDSDPSALKVYSTDPDDSDPLHLRFWNNNGESLALYDLQSFNPTL